MFFLIYEAERGLSEAVPRVFRGRTECERSEPARGAAGACPEPAPNLRRRAGALCALHALRAFAYSAGRSAQGAVIARCSVTSRTRLFRLAVVQRAGGCLRALFIPPHRVPVGSRRAPSWRVGALLPARSTTAVLPLRRCAPYHARRRASPPLTSLPSLSARCSRRQHCTRPRTTCTGLGQVRGRLSRHPSQARFAHPRHGLGTPSARPRKALSRPRKSKKTPKALVRVTKLVIFALGSRHNTNSKHIELWQFLNLLSLKVAASR